MQFISFIASYALATNHFVGRVEERNPAAGVGALLGFRYAATQPTALQLALGVIKK